MKNIFNSGISKKGYIEIFRTLQAYEIAVNEVAIVSITDLQGIIIYVNDKFTEITKYQGGELLGKTHKIVNSGFHPPHFFKEMWQTIVEGKPWRGEVKNKAKDGTYYWVDTLIIPVRDEKDQVFQYLSIRNLITRQKENEEKLVVFQKALLKREQQLKDAQEVAKTGSWHLDIPGNLLEWSAETYRIFEIPAGTPMTYELFLETAHPADRSRVEECWQAALSSGAYEIEHRIITVSGEKWVSEHARLEFDPSASLTRALGTVQDITEKKQVENTLKESETLYKNLFNYSPFAVGILDKCSLQFLEVNETATALYGYTRPEFLQLTAYDIRVSEQHSSLTELIENGNYTNDKTVRAHKKKNGEIILIEPTIKEIFYKEKKAFLISINDVTERIRMQEELVNGKINHQKEINRATLEAQEKSRAEIGRELHDNINQLLVASTLYLKKAIPASEKDKALMQQGTGIISNAIQEIRKLSSQFVPPSLNDLTLTDSIEHLAQNFTLTDCAVEFDIDINESLLEESLKINLYRIVQEQFSNIIKYAAATVVKVSMSQATHRLTLTIVDNGNGFDLEQKPKGIGLANILQRAEAYNGKVSVHSSPGEGCRLFATFALTEGQSPV